MHAPVSRARGLLYLAASLGLVAAILTGIQVGVSASLRESRAVAYAALLDTQAARLQQWIDERRADAEQLAGDPAIAWLAGAAPRDGCKDEATRRLAVREIAAFRFGARAPKALHLLDQTGQVLTSTTGDACGTRPPAEVAARLALARERGSVFVKPPAAGVDEHPTVWFEAPVRDPRGAVRAYVGYGLDAAEAFRFLAEQGRFGATGEIYVVDRENRALSALRRRPPLAGPLAANQLLDHLALGRNPAAGADPAGIVMAPYPGYAGTEVVGAWRWLPRRSIGLVLEVEAAEAYAPLYQLRASAGTLAILAAAALAAALAARSLESGGPARIGPYRVLSPLGEGAISRVYLAEHVLMRRRVALKVLKTHAANDEWLARFKREARLAGRLQHPNFVRLYDYGVAPGGGFYYAMEYLAGCNFAELVEREGPQPPTRVARLLRQACEALDEAHALGILHRDIKPQNLMVCDIAGQADVVKVLDFGLVKELHADESRDLTVGLRILGTPAYLAPERITTPGSTDPRSDLYAIGAVGFFLLTGHRPFESDGDLQLSHRILHETAPRASDLNPENVIPVLDDLIASCLAKSPDERPASARELARAFAALE